MYIYSVIPFSHVEEGNPPICSDLDEPGEHAKWNKPGTKRQIPHDLINIWNLRKVGLIEAWSRMVTRSQGDWWGVWKNVGLRQIQNFS